jgi:hypothetical protein
MESGDLLAHDLADGIRLIVLTIGPYSPVFAFDIIAKNRKHLKGAE